MADDRRKGWGLIRLAGLSTLVVVVSYIVAAVATMPGMALETRSANAR